MPEHPAADHAPADHAPARRYSYPDHGQATARAQRPLVAGGQGRSPAAVAFSAWVVVGALLAACALSALGFLLGAG